MFNLYDKCEHLSFNVGVKACLILLTYVFLFVNTGQLQAQDVENIELKPTKLWEKFKSNLIGGEPLAFSGGVGFGVRNYTTWGMDPRQSPFSWQLNGSLNASIYKIKFPFSFMINAQERGTTGPDVGNMWQSFQDSWKNKFMRFGASPYYKWVKLHLGHRSMDFSSLTYTGQTFLGVGIELTPKKYRFSAMSGLIPTTEPRDLALFEVNPEVFNRRVNTIKLGYGDDQNFIDFIIMEAEDRLDYARLIGEQIITPEENFVMGVNTSFKLYERLGIYMEAASSSYSTNKLGENIGTSTVFSPDFVINNNENTQASNAIKGGWKFQEKVFNIGMDYQRFSPGYRTMGAYYFNSDLQNITANTGFNFSSIQLSINLTGGVQNNNLDGNRPTQFRRLIGAANVNYAIKNLQLGFQHNSFSNSVDYVLNLEADSLNAVIVTQNTGVSASYTLTKDKDVPGSEDGKTKSARNSFALTANNQVVNDPDDTEGPGTKMRVANLSYSFSPARENAIKFTARANYNNNQLQGNTTNRYGLGFGVSNSFLKNMISIRLDANWFRNIQATGDVNQTLTNNLGINFKPHQSHSFNFKALYLVRNADTAGLIDNSSELVLNAQYQYRFQTKWSDWKKKSKEGGGRSARKTKKKGEDALEKAENEVKEAKAETKKTVKKSKDKGKKVKQKAEDKIEIVE